MISVEDYNYIKDILIDSSFTVDGEEVIELSEVQRILEKYLLDDCNEVVY